MSKTIAAANSGAPALLTDTLPCERSGDTTPYNLTVGDILKAAYPIGAVFLSVVSTDPATLLGFGTWAQIAQGQALFGQKSADTDFDTAEETGGAKTSTALLAHTHGLSDPGHTHTQDSHNHTQDAHNHTQDSHNHTQNSFAPRIVNSGTAGTVGVQGASSASNANASNAATTATNQAATATNQAATATNQAATATNQSSTIGIAATDSTGSGTSFSIVPPYFVVFAWKRTA